MIPQRLIFPLFLLVALVSYFPSIGSGFVFDFVGWQQRYEQGTWSDILHCFGYPGNQQVLHVFFYSLYRLFHISGLPWYLVFCGIHAFNAWLAYTWLSKLSTAWKINIHPMLNAMACMLFLLHPYAVEPVVWKACIHYLLSLTAILGLLHLAVQYTESGASKWLWFSLKIFAASLLLLELSYVTPVFLSLYLLICAKAGHRESFNTKRAVTFTLLTWALLPLCLLLNKATLGSWVGHYGSDVHFRMDVIGMAATEFKYLVKHVFDARFLSYPAKTFLFDQVLSDKKVVIGLMILSLAVFSLYLFRLKKWPGYIHLGALGLLGAMIYILPVSNLFFYHFAMGMNDRFSYVPLLFTWIALLACFSRLPKKISFPILFLVLGFQVYWQQKILGYWHDSTLVLESLKKDYRWHDRSHVFVLNSPDNYKGIVMASAIKTNSGIDELIDYQTDKPNPGIMYDVFQFNMTTPYDGVKVEQTGPMQLKVTFNQWGNWWHRADGGVTTYENEYYKAEPLEYPYQITFRQLPPNSAIIYQDSMKWKEFHLNK